MEHTHSILKTLGYARMPLRVIHAQPTVLRPHSCVPFGHLLVELIKQCKQGGLPLKIKIRRLNHFRAC